MQRKSFPAPRFMAGILVVLALLLELSPLSARAEEPQTGEALQSSLTVVGLCPSAQFAGCSEKLQGAAEKQVRTKLGKLCENKGGALGEPSCQNSCSPTEPPADKPVSSVSCTSDCQAPCNPL